MGPVAATRWRITKRRSHWCHVRRLRLEPLGRVIQNTKTRLGFSAHRTKHRVDVVDGNLAVLIRVCVWVVCEAGAVGQDVDDLQYVDRRDESVAIDVWSDLTGHVCRRRGCGRNGEVSGEESPRLQRLDA